MPSQVWKQVVVYYCIACALTWIAWSPLVLGKTGLGLIGISPSFPVFVSIGTLGPLIAAFATQRFYAGNWRAVRLFPSQPMRWLALVIGPLLVLCGFYLVFPALYTDAPPTDWRWNLGATGGLLTVMFNYNLFAGPLFEEFGWRGFLLAKLQTVQEPWTASLVVGALWALWHLPLFLLPQWSSASPFSYLLIVMGLSFVMTFGFNTAGCSVLVAILMHSAFNASPRFLGSYLEGNPMRSFPTADWYIAAAFLCTGAMLALFTRGQLARSADLSSSDRIERISV